MTPAQKSAVEKYRSDKGSAALELEIEVKQTRESLKKSETAKKSADAKTVTDYDDEVGFLYDSDFDDRGRLQKKLEPHPVVSASFSEFSGTKFRIVLCMETNSSVPAGYFVSGSVPYAIVSANIVPAVIGFDFRKDIGLYAFGPNGGRLVRDACQTDMSGAPAVFSPQTTKLALMPDVVVSFEKEKTYSDDPVVLRADGEKLRIRRDSDSDLIIPSASLSNPFSFFSAADDSRQITAVLMKSADEKLLDPIVPIKIDPGLIPSWNSKNWRSRDFELFEWDRFPGILYFDTADYEVQDDLFRRLAYFVEKTGYRGTLVSDEELAGKHGYNAHDYSASSLARFFNEAETSSFPLNKRERQLEQILIKNRVIVQHKNGTISEGKGAVISISQESPLYLRITFIAHEGWHGLYFTDSDFKNAIASIYYTMDPQTLAFLIKYFQITPTLNYDVNDDDLMKNEFMAYMLQRPLSQTQKYFVDMASREHSQWGAKKEADYIIKTNASGFCSAASMLNDYVAGRWGLAAGRVWEISR